MKIALDKAGSEREPELLHADGHLARIGAELVDALEAKFKALNPQKPEAWRELCGGCVLAITHNFVTEIIRRADCSVKLARRFREDLATAPNERDTLLEDFLAFLERTAKPGEGTEGER